ncbi:MAG TPA: hypothetical protein VEC11_14845 [Allosphingosinicella sp.]|nr:hypothetical protein [Allosphingosinicella sp.]
MARFYFHLRDGQDVLLDPEGVELEGLDRARDQARHSARSILAAEVLEGRVPLHMRIDVENGSGAIVHGLPFTEAVEVISSDD